MAASNLAPMKGESFYNRNSSWQKDALVPVFPLLQKAALSLPPLSNSSPSISLADLGCSQGANSQEPVNLVISTIRGKERKGKEEKEEKEKEKERPISVYHVDQPTNDFNSVFKVLSTSPTSYQRHHTGVFSFCEGKSFYQPLFPPSSLDMVMSFCALHWITSVPQSTSISIVATSAAANQEDRMAFSALAHRDLETFLRLRHAELKEGGKMVISLVASNDEMMADSDIVEHSNQLIVAMVERERITREEALRMKICIHYRSPAEIRKTLASCSDLFSLELPEDLHFARISHPLHRALLSGEISPSDYALVCSNFWRAIVEPSLALSLDDSRSGAEKESIIKELFEELTKLLTAKPSPVQFHMAYFLLTKI